MDLTTTDNKAILEITNNGKTAAQFIEYRVLYFSDGKVVDYSWGFCGDSDYEIKAGNTVFSEESVYGTDFDDVKVYLAGRAK